MIGTRARWIHDLVGIGGEISLTLGMHRLATPDLEMFCPIVMRFGNHGDDVLDLFVQAEGWPGRQIEHASLAPNADIFDYNSAKYPERHFLVHALQANPP